MKVVIDTNVFVAGVFFTGPPHQILRAWRDGKIDVVLSEEILEEYKRVGDKLAGRFPGVDLNPFLNLLTMKAEIINAPDLPRPVCDDPDDDKFLACAVASKCKMIISGDRHLVKVSGYKGVKVLRPRSFVDLYL